MEPLQSRCPEAMSVRASHERLRPLQMSLRFLGTCWPGKVSTIGPRADMLAGPNFTVVGTPGQGLLPFTRLFLQVLPSIGRR